MIYAVQKGAFVINISLNGETAGPGATEQFDAMKLVRDTDRLVVQSVFNTVGTDSSAVGTITRNLLGQDLENKDWFLFGVRVDQNLQAPAGNGLPGLLASRTLSVVATNTNATNTSGQVEVVNGNSYAAPLVAGAAALLKQYWPQLGGKAISAILLDTATDLGEKGVDQVYGAGLLNIGRALQPQATSQSLRAASTVLDRWSSVSLSPAFGGATGGQALSQAVSSMTVLDNYGRDYALAGQGHVAGQASGLLAAGMLPAEPVRWTVGPLNAALALTGSTYQDSRVAGEGTPEGR